MAVFTVDKPLGVTSHDVVARARKLLKTRRVGHAGTLDPLATGVLVILTEDATKLSPFLTESDKTYLTWVSFGASTPTLDAEGPIMERGDVSHLKREEVGAALPPFLELTEQLPPQYSAIKKGGVKGYEAARRGEGLELPPPTRWLPRDWALKLCTRRETRCRNASSLLSRDWQLSRDQVARLTYPNLSPTCLPHFFQCDVRAGTYIRAFARDLGEALGVPAHLSGLVRTKSGQSELKDALSLDDLPNQRGQRKGRGAPLSAY